MAMTPALLTSTSSAGTRAGDVGGGVLARWPATPGPGYELDRAPGTSPRTRREGRLRRGRVARGHQHAGALPGPGPARSAAPAPSWRRSPGRCGRTGRATSAAVQRAVMASAGRMPPERALPLGSPPMASWDRRTPAQHGAAAGRALRRQVVDAVGPFSPFWREPAARRSAAPPARSRRPTALARPARGRRARPVPRRRPRRRRRAGAAGRRVRLGAARRGPGAAPGAAAPPGRARRLPAQCRGRHPPDHLRLGRASACASRSPAPAATSTCWPVPAPGCGSCSG